MWPGRPLKAHQKSVSDDEIRSFDWLSDFFLQNALKIVSALTSNQVNEPRRQTQTFDEL
jgi:hypothetical protein